MVQESNNDSWTLLLEAVGLSGLSDYAAAIDVSDRPDVNTLSTSDKAHLLVELFDGHLLDPEHTAQLLSYMQDTANESLIRAAVPDGGDSGNHHGR
ncbi:MULTISPECIES: serine hydrolase [unclassified Arthrobacter]|uniref:serine hydrolase n=1 Tax=unclassified Arthrobacter TaxID=235627 RepID=UPI0033934791